MATGTARPLLAISIASPPFGAVVMRATVEMVEVVTAVR